MLEAEAVLQSFGVLEFGKTHLFSTGLKCCN